MPITLSHDVTKQLLASIKSYVAENLDQDIGDLKARMLLDYVLKEIAPTVYHRAITDAQAYFQGRVADLDGVCFEKEFGYWTQQSGARKARSTPPRLSRRRALPPERVAR